jgi:hypothetical protein
LEDRVYVAVVLALMLVLPVASILIEFIATSSSRLHPAVVLKWFVFWAVGVRLLLAGLRQIVQPTFTARTVLGLKSEESVFVVRELGFATAAMGCVSVASIIVPGWSMPMALIGAIFFGLAGANHLTHERRSRLQGAAMVSDLFIAVVLAACLLATWCS